MTFRIIRWILELGLLWKITFETGPFTALALLIVALILEINCTFLGNACLADRDALLRLAHRERARTGD